MKVPAGLVRKTCMTLFLLLGCTAALTTGCWSYRDVEDRAVVVAVGVDAAPDGLELVAQVALPGGASGGALQGATGGGLSGKPVWVVSAEGDSLEEATRNLQSRVSRELFWPHARILVIGDRLARRGIWPVVEAMGRHPAFRLTTWVVATPSPVTTILSARLPLGTIPATGLVHLRKTSTSYTPNLKAVWRALLEPGIDPALPVFTPLPVPRGGLDLASGRPAETVQVTGLALFRADRLVGTLDLPSAVGFLWVTNRLERSGVTVPCPTATAAGDDRPGRRVAIQVRHGQSRVRVSPGDPPHLRVDLTGVGEIIETEGCPLDVSKPAGLALVEQGMNRHIQRLAEMAVRRAKVARADVFGFGESVHRADPAGWAVQGGRWPDIFKDLPVDVHARATLRRTGLTK